MGRSLAHASLVAVCSAAIGKRLAHRYDNLQETPTVVPLGVDSEFFKPSTSPAAEDVIFHLGSGPRDLTHLVVRGYAEALEIAPQLPDLVVAGNLGTYSDFVSQLVEEAGIRSRVHLCGRITDSELRDYYRRAALCVQPSIYEGFGLQPLEALACGAPLIVSPEPAVAEVVQDAAITVTENVAPAFATAIAMVAQDQGLRSELRHRGPRQAARFPWGATAQRLASLLEIIAVPD